MSILTMLRIAVVAGCALFAVPAWAGEPQAQPLTTDKDKVNYAIGVQLVGNFKKQGIEIDLDRVIQGMKDAQAGGKLLLNDHELRTAISTYYKTVRQNQSKAASRAAEQKKALSSGPGTTAPAAAGSAGLCYRATRQHGG